MGYDYFYIYGLDGVNADRYEVRLDLGDGADIVDERLYDMKAGIFECSVRGVSRDGLEELLRGLIYKTK